MTHGEFNTLAARARLSERGRRAASKILVDGFTVSRAARETGIGWAAARRYRGTIIDAKRKVAPIDPSPEPAA